MTAGRERQFEVTTEDGLTLHARIESPASPAAALMLCHGITTDCDEHGSFPRLRDAATRAGLATVRFDFRAHGRSDGSNEELRLAGYRADANAIVALIDEQVGAEVPLIPLGVSFGGAAAVHVASSPRRCAGLCLWYAVIDYAWNFGEASPVPFTREMRAARGPGDPEWSEMPLGATGYYIPTALYAEFAEDRTCAKLAALSIPVLAYYGARDKLVSPAPIRRLAAQRPNVRLRIVPGAGHGFLLWRSWVIRRTVTWAAAAASPLGDP